MNVHNVDVFSNVKVSFHKTDPITLSGTNNLMQYVVKNGKKAQVRWIEGKI